MTINTRQFKRAEDQLNTERKRLEKEIQHLVKFDFRIRHFYPEGWAVASDSFYLPLSMVEKFETITKTDLITYGLPY